MTNTPNTDNFEHSEEIKHTLDGLDILTSKMLSGDFKVSAAFLVSASNIIQSLDIKLNESQKAVGYFNSIPEICEAIKKWCFGNEKSAREFAAIAAISPSTITRMKQGKDVSGRAILRIIAALKE